MKDRINLNRTSYEDKIDALKYINSKNKQEIRKKKSIERNINGDLVKEKCIMSLGSL